MTGTPKFSISEAEKCLEKALEQGEVHANYIPKVRLRQQKEIILESTHKTYKYICINALLGKTLANYNPLVLQKGSSLPRPWDARSMCHKVLCAFERKYLDGRLGSSNEPFLNKPARFPELSSENAVRRGRDRDVLETLFDFLEHVDTKTQEDAFRYLSSALYIAKQIPISSETLASIGTGEEKNNLFEFTERLLGKSFGGEVLTLITYACVMAFFRDSDDYNVVPHKLNQSGASSKETLDIDIYKAGSLVCGIEVKDKTFYETDFDHAHRKAGSMGAAFLFVSRSSYIDEFKARPDNASCLSYELISIEHLIGLYAALSLPPYEAFFQNMKRGADEINASPDVVNWIQSISS